MHVLNELTWLVFDSLRYVYPNFQTKIIRSDKNHEKDLLLKGR